MPQKIINNFLKKEENFFIEKTLMDKNFPWFFQKSILDHHLENKKNFHFGHCFYNQIDGGTINSDYMYLIKPLIKKLNIKSLVRAKANLKTSNDKHTKGVPHIDQKFKCKTAIYYVNSNNGYTMIEKQKVESVRNRIVIFSTDEMHYGVNCTDEQTRLLINFNYF